MVPVKNAVPVNSEAPANDRSDNVRLSNSAATFGACAGILEPDRRSFFAGRRGGFASRRFRRNPSASLKFTEQRDDVDQAQEKIAKLFELLEDEAFQRPWLFVGRKRDVPHNACDVGRCEHCYVWAAPWASRSLTKFVLIVLALAPSAEQDISGGGGIANPGGGPAYSPSIANGS